MTVKELGFVLFCGRKGCAIGKMAFESIKAVSEEKISTCSVSLCGRKKRKESCAKRSDTQITVVRQGNSPGQTEQQEKRTAWVE